MNYFTDDDLKRLKDSGLVIHTTFEGLKINVEALIARLDAAEISIQALLAPCCVNGKCDYEKRDLKARQALNEWRKAKGDLSDSEEEAGK
jgi:hypothetical protein